MNRWCAVDGEVSCRMLMAKVAVILHLTPPCTASCQTFSVSSFVSVLSVCFRLGRDACAENVHCFVLFN